MAILTGPGCLSVSRSSPIGIPPTGRYDELQITPWPSLEWRPGTTFDNRDRRHPASVTVEPFEQVYGRVVRENIAFAKAGLLEHTPLDHGVDSHRRSVTSLTMIGQVGFATPESKVSLQAWGEDRLIVENVPHYVHREDERQCPNGGENDQNDQNQAIDHRSINN
jgi:hypothetical protein